LTDTDPHTPVDADTQLVERTLAGDHAAFEMLVVKYHRRIERLIGRFVRDVDLVPDIAQETFIRAYKALASFRGDAQFYTWLYRIAINTAKKQLLELKKDPLIYEGSRQNDPDDDETSRPEREPTTGETPESLLASRQIADAVNQALSSLPDELRQALVLREMEGMSYEEIAQIMNSPIGTVRSRIFRAREAISQKIKPMLDQQSGKRW
jgi:RNA polymerase sigma-70 factor, ECF subfamily